MEKKALEYQLKQTKEVLLTKPDSEHFLKVKKVIEAQLGAKPKPVKEEAPKKESKPKEEPKKQSDAFFSINFQYLVRL